MHKPIIKVEQVVKQYPGVRALDGLSFELRAGEIFGLLGPNGAGKTTLLSCIEGLQRVDSGSILVNGADPASHPAQVKQSLGVQLQSTSLLPELNALEQVQLFASLYGSKLSRAEALALLEKVALVEKARALPSTMSGGQQQRLALALALVGNPSILILDEPTAGLDPQARHTTWDLIREFHSAGQTVLITTHYMDEAELLCDRVGIIDHGALLALDTPQRLINQLGGYSRITAATKLDPSRAERLPGVVKAWRDSGRLNLHTTSVPETISSLHALAAEQGTGIDQLSVYKPSLEEVFLGMTGRSIRDEHTN